MFIPELQLELTGKKLAIWLGKNDDGTPLDMPIEQQEKYRTVYRLQAQQQRARGNLQQAQQAKPKRGGGGCGCRKT